MHAAARLGMLLQRVEDPLPVLEIWGLSNDWDDVGTSTRPEPEERFKPRLDTWSIDKVT